MVELNVDFGPGLAERSLFADPGLIRRIQQSILPFRAAIEPGPAGVRVRGDAVGTTLTGDILKAVAARLAAGGPFSGQELIDSVVQAALKHKLAFRLEGVTHPLQPRTLGQVAFMDAMLSGDRPLILGIGPAGAGKTHLAIAAGLSLVAAERYRGLIVTRSAVGARARTAASTASADEGSEALQLPVWDVLRQMIGAEEIRRRFEQGDIETTPVHLMRGRTFSDAFIIVDDAQNLTIPEMRMVLTRLGDSARMVVVGDPGQVDLPPGEASGLTHALSLLSGAEHVHIHQFQPREVIRNDLVSEIEALYERDLGQSSRPAA